MSERTVQVVGTVIGLVIGVLPWWAIAHYLGWEWFAAVAMSSVSLDLKRRAP